MAREMPTRRTYDCYVVVDREQLRGVALRERDGTYTVALDATPALCAKLGCNWPETQRIFVNLTAAEIMFFVGEIGYA